MSDVNRNDHSEDAPAQPLSDGDATGEPRAAQREWESTESPADPSDPTTASGARQAWDEEIPLEDLPTETMQPETQGEDPVTAALGEEGQGDLAPEDE